VCDDDDEWESILTNVTDRKRLRDREEYSVPDYYGFNIFVGGFPTAISQLATWGGIYALSLIILILVEISLKLMSFCKFKLNKLRLHWKCLSLTIKQKKVGGKAIWHQIDHARSTFAVHARWLHHLDRTAVFGLQVACCMPLYIELALYIVLGCRVSLSSRLEFGSCWCMDIKLYKLILTRLI